MTFIVPACTLPLPMVEKGKKRPKTLYPEFGKRVDGYIVKFGFSNQEVAEAIDQKRGEMVRRYRGGEARPDDDETMRKLAKLFHTSPGELRYGDPKVPGIVTVPVAEVTPDEQVILEAYRHLPRAAKKALRVRATELAEEFAAPSKATPFGKARKHDN